MLIRAGFEMDLSCDAPLPMVLALSPHTQLKARIVGDSTPRSAPSLPMAGHVDGYGNLKHRVTVPAGAQKFWADFAVEMPGTPDPVVREAEQHAIADLPDEALHFLKPSRYCDSDAVADFAWANFPAKGTGWDRVQAICDFVHGHIQFGYGHGRSDRTASEGLAEGQGVCRDYAHLAIALCRAVNIPARYASGYLGDIGVPYAGPGDFCAWFEAFIGGRWYTFDARYNMPRIGRVLMVRGADAADAAIVTSFGPHRLDLFRVWCDPLPDMDDGILRRVLSERPDAEALVFPTRSAA